MSSERWPTVAVRLGGELHHFFTEEHGAAVAGQKLRYAPTPTVDFLPHFLPFAS